MPQEILKQGLNLLKIPEFLKGSYCIVLNKEQNIYNKKGRFSEFNFVIFHIYVVLSPFLISGKFSLFKSLMV
jgi:cytochrome c biogenesis protein ResB